MNKTFLSLAVLGLIAIIGWYSFSSLKTKIGLTTAPERQTQSGISTASDVNYSAGFAIFTNGTFRIFTAPMYHNLSEDVFIKADNPNIVHVKKSGITWDDFFKTLPFKLSKDCLTTGTKQTFCTSKEGSLEFYLNGKKEDDLLSKEIKDGDRALITYGNENEKQIENQFQQVPRR